MITQSIQTFRTKMSDTINRVEYQREVVVVLRHSRHAAVVVSKEDVVDLFEQVEALASRLSAYGGGDHPAVERLEEMRDRMTHSTWFEVKP